MKRFILLFSIFFSVSMIAQPPIRTKTYTFNFGNPESLIPSIKRSNSEGGGVPITNKVFKSSDGKLSMSFDNSNTNPQSDVRIVTGNAASGKIPYLTFERSVTLNVSAPDANLLYFRIPAAETIGGLIFKSTSPTENVGTFAPDSRYEYNVWENNGDGIVNSLTLLNNSPIPPVIQTIEVCYELPRDILTPQNVSITNGATLTNFTNLSLTFANNMTVTDDVNCSLSDGTNTYSLNAQASGNVVTLSSAEPITTDGNYTLTIAAGSFVDTEYYRNEALTYTFKINKPFEIQSITPESGAVNSIPNTIVLTFASAVGTVKSNLQVKLLNGLNEVIRVGTATATGTNTVAITFSNTASVTENGVFTLIIPKKLIYDAEGTHYNTETKFVYNIGDIASDELQAKAASYLSLTGLGYPKSDDAARTALAALTSNGSTTQFTTALTNYLKSTNVEMPVNGNYYYISAVAKGGNKMYMKYINGQLGFTDNKSEAIALKTVASGNGFIFATPDNNYITTNGVTNAQTVLTLAKFAVASATDEDAFGLFSIYGSCDSADAYALVNMAGAFVTDPGLSLSSFSSSLTNAFMLEKVADTEIPVPDVVYTLNPASGSSVALLSKVNIVFPNNTSVNLANQNLIKLTKSDGTQYIPGSVSLAEGKSNEYVITFTDIKNGNYTLNIGKGAFSYTFALDNGNNIAASVQAIVATYTVTTGDDFVYDFTQKNTIYRIGPMDLTAPKDVDLNNLIFFSNDIKIGVSNEVVKIVNYNSGELKAQGKFKLVSYDQTLPEEAKDAKCIIKLVLDNKIAAGSLPAAQYAYIINQGTFGDENFGAYNSDPAAFLATGKAKADCHANPYIYYIVSVNNTTPSGGDDDQQPAKPSETMLAKVKKYLDMSGVGYPKSNALERTALLGMYNSKSGSDDVFQAALTAYLSTSNIDRPVSNKYYTIAAQSSDGSKAYLTYANGDVTVTTDASKASAFKATTNNDGKTSFATVDGKYLTALTAKGNLLTTYKAVVNDLSLNTLPVANNMLEKSFGLVSLEGIKNDTRMMSKVNVKTPSITTNGNSFEFGDTQTCGFKLVETDPSTIPAPTPVCTLNPANGAVLTSLQMVELSITGVNDVKLADKDKIIISDGKNSTKVTSVNTVSSGKFKLIFPEFESGEYTLTIAKGAFVFTFLERTIDVDKITAKYSVAQYPSEAVLKYAIQLLENTGVGYPTADSKARKNLQALVDGKIGSDNKFNEAITAYKAEVNVEKPGTDKFYRIAGKNNANLLSYLQYADGKISMTGNVQNAVIFKATANNDGSITLATLDGKYLNLLEKDATNVSETAVKFTIGRLLVNDVSSDDTYGMVSMSVNGKYSTVNVPSALIMNAQAKTTLSANATSGFVFFEVDKSEIEMPDADFTLTPVTGSVVETLDNVVLTFNVNAAISLKDKSKVVLSDLTTSKTYAPKSLERVKENVYKFNFINLPASTYRLIIGKGTFVMNFLGSETSIQEIKAVYTVTEDPKISVDYEKKYQLVWNEHVEDGKFVRDTYLNTFSLSSNVQIVLNPKAKPVKICKSWSLSSPVAEGHLEYADDKASGANKVKLVLDKAIKEGDLQDDDYLIIIPEESFGDENYGKYLSDPESVVWSDCHVNSELKYSIKVKNNDEINVDFVDVFEVEWVEEVADDVYVKDTYLNKFTLASSVPMATDPTRIVNICKSWNTYSPVVTGHLEIVKSNNVRGISKDENLRYSIKLVLDKEINEGDLSTDTYSIIIPEGAFGDENYGKYLADPTSVLKSECHINPQMVFNVKVNNALSGISEISIDGSDSPVYNINGRKVEGKLVSGRLYIKDGKKFLIKK